MTPSKPNAGAAALSLALVVCALGGAMAAAAATYTPAPQRLPRPAPKTTAALQGIVREEGGRGLPGAALTLRNLTSGDRRQAATDAEGVFRLLELPPGRYELIVEKDGFESMTRAEVELAPGQVLVLDFELRALPAAPAAPTRLPRRPELGPLPPMEPESPAPAAAPYPSPGRRPDAGAEVPPPALLPPSEQVFIPVPDRWSLALPEWKRYAREGEFPYTKGRWWDPFNLNRLKGDRPLWGQTFLNFTFTSDTFFDGRRLPLPSNVSSARPGSEEFFGRGEQAFFTETFRFSFDLFRGDTAYRPFDWRVRVTPAVSLNYLNTRERGIVNIDVREGTNRPDAHFGLQEAFFEAKLRDLSPSFDFLSVRVGTQIFSSDFRGFLFVEEQPGLRVFGNLHSNRWEYNLAYFFLLEKDTNSALNTFDQRHQQVFVANLYVQDFFWAGYTTQFSLHYSKDDESLKFDKNDFLVRPAPMGAVEPHDLRVGYLGWTGNGHIGRLNISHAFYQAVGDDDLNPLAGRRLNINAQMAAVELSVDKDWARFKGSFFWASGDSDPRDDNGRGFDAIVDFPVFAGGLFSLWNRQGIRLTGTGVALVNPNSLLPSLRPSKEQGQANFVNPGLFLFNGGADFELTPQLRSVINVNWLRFHHTQPLELLLFQAPIRENIGLDYNLGLQYRPPLTDNIVVTGGLAFLTPAGGFKDIYTGRTLFSFFSNVRVQF